MNAWDLTQNLQNLDSEISAIDHDLGNTSGSISFRSQGILRTHMLKKMKEKAEIIAKLKKMEVKEDDEQTELNLNDGQL